MRKELLLAIYLSAVCSGFAQDGSTPAPGLPQDPHAILDAAKPYYNFDDPALKPWHMKATYQLYNEQGKPYTQGTYEYWWASPKVHRSTWSRSGAIESEWDTADGKYAFLITGDGFNAFEHKLQDSFLVPLPGDSDLNASRYRLDCIEKILGNVKLRCMMVIPKLDPVQTASLGSYPTYCFDPNLPALLFRASFESTSEVFGSIIQMQGHFLPENVQFYLGGNRILSAKVELLEGISASDPIFIPDPQASFPSLKKVSISAGNAVGMLKKKVVPEYPPEARAAHISGTVVLEVRIGRDGRVHDLSVISSPSTSLATSAQWAVSQWQYRPYVLNGIPIEVWTTINVVFALGQ